MNFLSDLSKHFFLYRDAVRSLLNQNIRKGGDEKLTPEEEKKERQRIAMEKRVRFVCEQTGWTYEYAREKMLHSKKYVGSTFEYYAGFRLWESTEEEQKKFFLKRDADSIVSKFNTNRDNIRVAWNKQIFLSRFRDYVGRPWIITSKMTYDDFYNTFKDEKKLIYKPKSASAGAGIEVFDLSESSMHDIYNRISKLEDGVVEGFLKQHPDMQKLSLKGVNTIRVVTLCTDKPFTGIEPHKVYIAYAAVRMCRGDAYTDNAHQGGIVAAVDLEKGEICTNAFGYDNKSYAVHPDTGTVIKGFKLPYFQEMKDMISKAGLLVPGYFGWDIAISETGPVVIELNSHPGAELLQLPYVPERKGMRYVMERFIDAQPLDAHAEMKTDAKKTPSDKLLETAVVYSGKMRVPDEPYGLKISDISSTGIEFYWKKLAVADGYEVFRIYSKLGSPELIYTAPRRNIGTYRDNTFDHSKKKVYYTVRSYVDNPNGERVYSKTATPVEAAFIKELLVEREVTYLYDGGSRNIKTAYGWGEPKDGFWRSTNESVATVTAEGCITGVATGSCDLVYTSPSLGKSVVSRVIVNRAEVPKLRDDPARFHYNSKTGYWENPNAVKDDSAVIIMVGDLMCGATQMKEQYTEQNGWDFTESFRFTREVTQEADFAAANLETLLAPGWPYMADEVYINNFNNCNAPSRYLEAVRYGGFDAVMMANNHNCDGGVRALMETIDQVDRYEFVRTGVFKDEVEPRCFIADIKGIKVGFLAYMSKDTGFNGKDNSFSAEEKRAHLNIFSAEKARRDISSCRARGAEYVIVYMHWGKKNFRTITEAQAEEAIQVANAGADYIVGSNPHLVQRYDELVTKDNRIVPCFYSVGNYQTVMNQVQGNRDSALIRIQLVRNALGQIVLMKNNYIPCHAYRAIGTVHWAPVALSDNYNSTLKKIRRDDFYSYILKTIGSKIKPV